MVSFCCVIDYVENRKKKNIEVKFLIDGHKQNAWVQREKKKQKKNVTP